MLVKAQIAFDAQSPGHWRSLSGGRKPLGELFGGGWLLGDMIWLFHTTLTSLLGFQFTLGLPFICHGTVVFLAI